MSLSKLTDNPILMALFWLSVLLRLLVVSRSLNCLESNFVTEPIGLCFFLRQLFCNVFLSVSLGSYTKYRTRWIFLPSRSKYFSEATGYKRKMINEFCFPPQFLTFCGASFRKDFAVVRTRETLCGISNLRSSIDWKFHVEIEPRFCSSFLYFLLFIYLFFFKLSNMSNVKEEKISTSL
jgi:hypothetical protein